MQTNKGRKVVRESYDSEAEKAYGWVGPDLFSEFFIAFSYTHFASLDTPEPLLYHSALISTFIDIWNSIDHSFSLLPLRTSIFIVIVTITVWWTHTTLVAASSTLSFPLPLAVQSICHGSSNHHICYQQSRNISHCYASKPSLWREIFVTQKAGPCCDKLKLWDWLHRQRLPGLIAVHTFFSKSKCFTFSTYSL